jgi:hypothetical protein
VFFIPSLNEDRPTVHESQPTDDNPLIIRFSYLLATRPRIA